MTSLEAQPKTFQTSDDPCQFLQWDTEFFGYRISRILGNRLDERLLDSIYSWSQAQNIDCLYFLTNADDRQSIRLAEKHGFQLVEIRIILERSLKDWDPETRPKTNENILTRPVRPEDIPILQDIAKTSYVDSRYYFDEHISEEKWQAYYATWIKKAAREAQTWPWWLR